MTSGKLLWLIGFLVTFFKGNCLLNSSQSEVALSKILHENETLLPGDLHSSTTTNDTKVTFVPLETTTTPVEFNTKRINSTDAMPDEKLEILKGLPKNANGTDVNNSIIIADCVNINSVNMTCAESSWNDTAKTNYTLEAKAPEALNSEDSTFRLEKSAAIAAGVFLVSAIIGYLSCVGYRRFLQRKYGNSQVLIAEEVYDTTDLRYFEI